MAKAPPTKKGLRLHNYLTDELNFNVIQKFIKLYENDERLCFMLNKILIDNAKKQKKAASKNGKRGQVFNPLEGIDKDHLNFYLNTKKDLTKQLTVLISYMYPKMTALKLDTDEADRVTFNINVV